MVLEEEEEEEMETQVITNDENPSATNAEEDDIVAQEKKQAQEEVLQAEPVVTNEEKDNQKTEDANMATETDEVIQTQDTGSATEAMPGKGLSPNYRIAFIRIDTNSIVCLKGVMQFNSYSHTGDKNCIQIV